MDCNGLTHTLVDDGSVAASGVWHLCDVSASVLDLGTPAAPRPPAAANCPDTAAGRARSRTRRSSPRSAHAVSASRLTRTGEISWLGLPPRALP
jgi:hypothetical protein